MVLEENGKKIPPIPTQGAPMFFLRSFPPLPKVSGADCSFEDMNKLTRLFWANGQRQTCQWLRQLARHKTPQYPFQTSFSFGFPSVPLKRDRNTFSWYQSGLAGNTAISSAVYAMNAHGEKQLFSCPFML